ncbi:MAG: filamentous hemagglutinin N-terminal domain-containing protein [Rivularia sp. (in: Bacteria)]|nr:filamentous hemagglutinin N-terminal domain-containing protein [Rivularia sp. MS3]
MSANLRIILAATAIFGAAFISSTNPVKAQNITLDGSLGKQQTLQGADYNIPQSMGQTAGNNLFHSFEKFNLNANEAAIFQSNDNIQNILSRVTGGNASSIDGLIRTLNKDVNFFLINPNGIVFGENARLDVGGSFVASTADAFVFNDGSEFSAINPQAAPLLKVNITPGLQYGENHASTTIKSTGNLAAGQDLKLDAGNLDLRGQLQAGKDLILQGDNVKIRDSVDKPFIAAAGNKLSVLGRESVDIFALNHSESGLFSRGDMVLQSAIAINGDAHFHSGGSFRVEKLDDSLGSLFSPNGAIIRAGGDVSFDSYTGASLHIFAGGSVNVPEEIKITGTAENSIREQVTLSDGKTLVDIDGSSKPTLDIRVGIVGSKEIGDINIRSVSVESADGLVFLSNKYQSDESKKDGSIELTQIFVDAYSFIGNAGSVFIDSAGDINVRAIYTSSGSGNGGDINILADNSIQLQRTNINSSSSFGRSGNVNIFAKNSIQLERSLINSATVGGEKNAGDISIKTPQLELKGSSVISASTSSRSSGNGGNINIYVDSLKIDEGSDIISASGGAGKGGDITVNATDLIEIVGFSRVAGSGISSQASGIDKAGNVSINTGKLILRDGGGISVSTRGEGDAGNIDITAKSIEIYNREANNLPLGTFVLNPLSTSVPTGLSTQTNPGSTGNAGNITINTDNLLITDSGQVTAQTLGGGDSGKIDVKAKEIELIGTSEKFVPTLLSSGTASAVDGKAGNLTITTERLSVSEEAQITTGTLGLGKGANLRIDATEFIEVTNSGLISSGSNGIGDAGDLILNAPIVKVLNGGQILSATNISGKGGSLTINATKLFELRGTSSEGIESFLASTTFGTGNAGKLTITAPTVLVKDTGQIRADTFNNATGNGNDINIQADKISLSNQADISAGTTSKGNAGNIIVTANNFEADSGSKLRTATNGSKKAGNITLNIKDNLTLNGSETGIFADTEKNSTGNGGSIFIDPEVVNIFDGALISVNSSGEGIGGDIELAAGKLNLDNGKITAETRSNIGGDITLNIQDLLLLRNNSQISTTAGDEQFGGDGGNININSPFIVALPQENSDITANAFSGNGGEININTRGIFGIFPQDSPTNNSDITASSQTGINGEINIDGLDIDPNRGVIELPSNLVDASEQVAQACTPGGRQNAGTFVATGRGGLPLNPNQPVRKAAVITNWVDLPSQTADTRVDKLPKTSATKYPRKIVEAQKILVDKNGDTFLVAESAQNSHTSSTISCS